MFSLCPHLNRCPAPIPDADRPSDALTWRPIDSVVLSALRNNQWLLGGASTSVALQGCHTVSANYRHHLLLPPVSNPPQRTDHTTAMDSTTLPKIPFLLCPPSFNPKLCLSVSSGSGFLCVWVCEVSAMVAEFIYVVCHQSCLDSLVMPSVLWYTPAGIKPYDWESRSDRVGIGGNSDGHTGWRSWFWRESGKLLQMFSANVCSNQILHFKVCLHATGKLCCLVEMNWRWQ